MFEVGVFSEYVPISDAVRVFVKVRPLKYYNPAAWVNAEEPVYTGEVVYPDASKNFTMVMTFVEEVLASGNPDSITYMFQSFIGNQLSQIDLTENESKFIFHHATKGFMQLMSKSYSYNYYLEKENNTVFDQIKKEIEKPKDWIPESLTFNPNTSASGGIVVKNGVYHYEFNPTKDYYIKHTYDSDFSDSWKHFVEKYSPGYSNNYHNDSIEMSELSRELPGVDAEIVFPCDCLISTSGYDLATDTPYIKDSRPREGSIWKAVQHLNDKHRWTREKIADWLDELHDSGQVNIEFEVETISDEEVEETLDGWTDVGYTTEGVEFTEGGEE